MKIARFVGPLALIALAGCGSHQNQNVDMKATYEAEIAKELNQSYVDLNRKVDKVACPSEVSHPVDKKTYDCTASLGEFDVHVGFTVNGDQKFIEARDKLVDLKQVADQIAGTAAQREGHPVTVDCGIGLRVVPDGSVINCIKSESDGATQQISVPVHIAERPTK